ncbi:hypothetical protein DEO23_01695 [Brachybacterium endophyticum]|uniref:HTH lysR-type domain-containing protein n=1 Tax=Brachybacterium endophyticum TaxID=2182385 RepID=A0A2U2RND4_9MICO|nr:LysR family transcriptional regulator [Brachybacterium endophyticum]PWH07382.1 hypothetical protein DEO23_01695 [Brachybacterium endophyticum]
MRVTLRQVEVFSAVARTGHFGRAADQLHLSQPTVSADLRGLERALGVQLIARSRGGSRLTSAGSAALPWALEILTSTTRLQEAARGAPESVRLAVTPSILNRIVPELMARRENAEDGLDIEILKVDTGGVESQVHSGQADVGIGHYLRPRGGLRRSRLGDDEIFALTASGVLDPERPVHLSDLQRRSLLLWPREQNPVYFDAILEVCRRHGLDPELAPADSELSGAYSYRLRSGESFTLVPADYARDASTNLSAAPLTPSARLPLQAIHRTPLAPGVGRMLDEVKAVVRAHQEG